MTLITILKTYESIMVDDTEVKLTHISEERDNVILSINHPHNVDILSRDFYDAVRQKVDYGDYIAQQKGFINLNEYQLHIAKEAGFETFKEYADSQGIDLNNTYQIEQYAIYEKFREYLNEGNYLEAYRTYLKCKYIPHHHEYESLVKGLGNLVESLTTGKK